MGVKTFATKAFLWVREGFASWGSMCRFLRSLKENDDLDFYQGLDERAICFKNFAGYGTGTY